MVSQRRYTKRGLVLFLCMLAKVSLLSAADLIVTQPVSDTICKAEGAVTFTVTGNSAYTLLYRWYMQRQGSSVWEMIQINGTGSSYDAWLAGKYRCVVTKSGSSPLEQETSQEVTLTIRDVPVITGIIAPPVCDNSNFTASADRVVTNGSDLLRYEWKLGGIPVKNGAVSNNAVDDLVYPVTVAQNNQILTLSLTNGCGTATSSPIPITVWATPVLPTPVAGDYCQGAASAPLYIVEPPPNDSTATWYDAATGGSVIPAPIPDTSTPGTQTWWVSQKEKHAGGPTCESGRAQASVTVYPQPALPSFEANIALCLYDPGITLQATGTETIQWYDQQKESLPVAPQINASAPGEQIYYVTQKNGNKCESPIDDGKITVRIRSRANMDAITLKYNPALCPNNSTEIEATSQVPDPTFQWYANNDKTGWLQTGSTYTTPVLTGGATYSYYVTVEYEDMCESSYPQAATITVRDVTMPEFVTLPQNIVVNTDDGVCYATGVVIVQPRVFDICTDSTKLQVYTDPVAPTVYSLGNTSLVWWVKDEAGNKDRALQVISVIDSEIPRGTCPDDIIVEVNDDENSAVVTYKLDYTDNCSGVTSVMITKKTESGAVFQLGTTPVKYEITDAAGNTAVCEFNVIVRHPYRPMEVALRAYPYEVCPGGEIVVSPVISGGSGTFAYSWKPRPWNEAVLKDYPLVSTVYELTVSDDSTTQTKTVNVTVLEPQQVTLTLQGRPMDEIFEGDEVLVTATSGFVSYKLLLNNKVVQAAGLNNSVSFQAELGTYFVRVFATDINSCVTQDQLEVDIDSRKLPNVFTPNHDGKNDIFLEGFELQNGFELQVFSRAGELLYKGVDGWDGTCKGKLMPQGTYLYVVKRTMNNGEQRIFKGTVTLKL